MWSTEYFPEPFVSNLTLTQKTRLKIWVFYVITLQAIKRSYTLSVRVAIVLSGIYSSAPVWNKRTWKTYSETSLCVLQNTSGTIRLKPNPNPENAVENLGFLRNYASSDQIERLNRWAIKSRDSIARWNRTRTMFYFDNTLIIRHIVLIALLLAMGPALHNPESKLKIWVFFFLWLFR